MLGLVKTEDEALEHIVALVQLYREQARYLERIYKWAKRVGLDEIRRQILDDPREAQGLFRSLRTSAGNSPRSIRGPNACPARTSTNSGHGDYRFFAVAAE